MTTTTADDVIRAATSVARDVAESRLRPSELEAEALRELSALCDTDAEPGSELEGLQLTVARRALAAGLVPADELSEWLSVARSRSGGGALSAEV